MVLDCHRPSPVAATFHQSRPLLQIVLFIELEKILKTGHARWQLRVQLRGVAELKLRSGSILPPSMRLCSSAPLAPHPSLRLVSAGNILYIYVEHRFFVGSMDPKGVPGEGLRVCKDHRSKELHPFKHLL
jgi:hypothetical protein